MEPTPRKYKSVDELPDMPPEFLAEAERIARQYSAALKALAKH